MRKTSLIGFSQAALRSNPFTVGHQVGEVLIWISCQSLKTNFALNDMEDRVEIIEEDASDKVDKLRYTTNIDALSRIVTDEWVIDQAQKNIRFARTHRRADRNR
jgi:hypothetical protein